LSAVSATEQDLAEDAVAANIAEDEERFGDQEPARPQDQEPEAVTSEDEMERLDPVPDTYTFADGTTVAIERLKTRQFFKLLRIITHGGMDALQSIRLDPNQGTEVFTENLIALLIFAVPESEDETIEFLRAMVTPQQVTVPDDVPPSSAIKVADNLRVAAKTKVDSQFTNMGLDDLLGLVEVIIRREAPELKALGKRLADTLKFNRAAQGQGSDTAPSLEASQEPST
jgi:hypothetical protein